MSERALSMGLVGYMIYTILGLAFNPSPAALRAVKGLSRATRGKLTQSLLAGKGLLKRLAFQKESQNVLPASNPSATVRVSLTATSSQAFSLSLLAVEEKFARESWTQASSAIGSGLSRPELYLSSRENSAVHVSPHLESSCIVTLIYKPWRSAIWKGSHKPQVLETYDHHGFFIILTSFMGWSSLHLLTTLAGDPKDAQVLALPAKGPRTGRPGGERCPELPGMAWWKYNWAMKEKTGCLGYFSGMKYYPGI